MVCMCVLDTDGIICLFMQSAFLEVAPHWLRGYLGEEELRD